MAVSHSKESTFDSTSVLASYPPAPRPKGKGACVAGKSICKPRQDPISPPGEEKDAEQEPSVIISVDPPNAQKLEPVAFTSLFRYVHPVGLLDYTSADQDQILDQVRASDRLNWACLCSGGRFGVGVFSLARVRGLTNSCWAAVDEFTLRSPHPKLRRIHARC